MSTLKLRHDGRTLDVVVEADSATVEGQSLELADVQDDGRWISFCLDGKFHRLAYQREGSRVHVAFGGSSLTFDAGDEERQTTAGPGAFAPEILSPMPGKILEVLVCAGDQVEADAPLLLMEAMKMETTIKAPSAARVAEVKVSADQMVGPGELLVRLTEVD